MSDLVGDGFYADDFLHTHHLLVTGSDAVVKASLSNNYNIILAALIRAAAVQKLMEGKSPTLHDPQSQPLQEVEEA